MYYDSINKSVREPLDSLKRTKMFAKAGRTATCKRCNGEYVAVLVPAADESVKLAHTCWHQMPGMAAIVVRKSEKPKPPSLKEQIAEEFASAARWGQSRPLRDRGRLAAHELARCKGLSDNCLDCSDI